MPRVGVEDPINRVRTELAETSPWLTRQQAAEYFSVPDRARHADETRDRLSAGFGHLLASGR